MTFFKLDMGQIARKKRCSAMLCKLTEIKNSSVYRTIMVPIKAKTGYIPLS